MLLQNNTFVWLNTQMYCKSCCCLDTLRATKTTFLTASRYNEPTPQANLEWESDNQDKHTFTWNHASAEQRRMSQLHTISTPPPTHPEWMAAMTGCGHFSITRKDSWSCRINFLNMYALLEGSWLGFIRSLPMSMRSRPIKSQD